jgi:hypothetical protein
MSYDNTCYEQTMKQEISYTTGIDFFMENQGVGHLVGAR